MVRFQCVCLCVCVCACVCVCVCVRACVCVCVRARAPSLLVSSCGIICIAGTGVAPTWPLSTSELERLELDCPIPLLLLLLG